MKNNIVPDIDFEDKYKKIVGSKQHKFRSVLTPIETQVVNQFTSYDQNIGSWGAINSIITSRTDESKALLHCYNSPTAEMEDLRNKIYAAQVGGLKSTCQYCQISEPFELDHFLEKSKFEEFATYGKNLVPCCGKCNKDRPDDVITSAGQQIINFYYDVLPTERFLFCDFQTSPDLKVKYRVANTNGINATLFQTIENHFKNLGLTSRYNTKCTDDLADIISKFSGGDVNEISSELNDEGIRFSESRSLNHWKVALYLSASQDQRFLTYLSQL